MKQLLLIILVSSLSNSAVFTQNTTLPTLIEKIIATNGIWHHYIGYEGTSYRQYPNLKKLKQIASINELIHLTKHKNGIVRCYAAWALADLQYSNFEQIFKELGKVEKIISQLG
ncbi:MAG: hypothetical protein AB8G86_06700 [Saprospiraceae bacterium]